MTVRPYKSTALPVLSLFTSVSTLLCCALPALLVTLGLGAVLAGVVSAIPWLTVISEYKVFVFFLAGILLTIALYFQWQAESRSCPVDVELRIACARLKKISWLILLFSTVIYLFGFFFAFVAVHII